MSLLPCPFCGGSAQVERMGNKRQSMIIACENCGCRVESSDEEWVDRKHWHWNQRTPLPAEVDRSKGGAS